MIATDDFVFVHFPKNGGTFVTEVLRRIHNRRAPNWWVNRLYNRWLGGGHAVSYQEFNKHGACFEIPEPHRSKPIASVIRDPFDRYVSSYFFGWWKHTPEDFGVTAAAMKEKYPSFPDLNFPTFVRACCEDFSSYFDPGSPIQKEYGWYSRNVVLYYFREPRRAASQVAQMDDDALEAATWGDYMFDVTFLHTENLNRELYDFLRSVGYKKKTLEFILDMGEVRPENQSEDRGKTRVEEMFTPELVKYVLQNERLFFSVFPEYREASSIEGIAA